MALWMSFFLMGWVLRYFTETGKKMALALLFLTLSVCYSGDSPATIILILGIVSVKILPTLLNKVLAFLGVYSMCMWLNHRLIFGYWFSSFFYSLPTPINIFLVIGISLAVSYLVTNAWKKLFRTSSCKHRD